jgi:ferredoxin
VAILQANVPGKYQVDERCIGCAICSEITPYNFRIDHERGYSYVYKQPESEIEECLCAEAVDICPVNAIGTSAAGSDFGPAQR